MQEGGIFVFQNATTPLGGIEVLRQMDINSAYSLRFMDASEAQATLPGLRNRQVEGAIIVYVTPAGRGALTARARRTRQFGGFAGLQLRSRSPRRVQIATTPQGASGPMNSAGTPASPR
jgi:hypothetical protein